MACKCSASGRSAGEKPKRVAYFCSSRRHKAMTRLSRQRSSPLEGPSMFQNFANLERRVISSLYHALIEAQGLSKLEDHNQRIDYYWLKII